jgi:hypothetical protein
MWALLLALSAHAGNLTVTESADSIGEARIVYGGSGSFQYASIGQVSASIVQAAGWTRYGFTDDLDVHGKLYFGATGGVLLIGVSAGTKYQIAGDKNRTGLQMAIGAIGGVPSFRFNPLQVQVPFTIGYRTSPDFAVYGRPMGQVDVYTGAVNGLIFIVGATAGVEITGLVPLNIELDYARQGQVNIIGFAVGSNISI